MELSKPDLKVKVHEEFFRKYIRVLKLARTPTREEFSKIAVVAAAGVLLIGLIGFIIFIKSAEGKAVVKAGYGAAKHVGKVYTERRMFIDRPTRTDISKAVDQYHKDEAMRSAQGGVNYSGKAGSSVERLSQSYGKVEDRFDQEQ